MHLRLGTRGSLLALTQSRWVAKQLEASGDVQVELVTIRTQGDEDRDRPLPEIGGKGLFTKELDLALLDESIDLAVHSLKDLPTELPAGLRIGAVPEREDARDVLIGPEGEAIGLLTLRNGATVGTSSLRRAALVRAHRSDLRVESIRGNLDTRVKKVDSGEYDAIVMAAAGVRRLGWEHRIGEYLEPRNWLPAPGQGALAVVVRQEDQRIRPWLHALDHLPSRAATTAERSLLHTLGAGCSMPVAALGLPFGGGLRLKALVAHPDGRRAVRAEATGAEDAPESLGRRVAELLLKRGADILLGELRGPEVTILQERGEGRR